MHQFVHQASSKLVYKQCVESVWEFLPLIQLPGGFPRCWVLVVTKTSLSQVSPLQCLNGLQVVPDLELTPDSGTACFRNNHAFTPRTPGTWSTSAVMGWRKMLSEAATNINHGS